MNATTLRAGCSAGFLLVALYALALPVSAEAAGPAWAVPALAATLVQCPCNPDLPRQAAVAESLPPCPCNAGLPDGPSGALAVSAGSGRADAGSVAGSSAEPVAAGGGFDWADAGVGAGVAALVGGLVAGAAIVVGRRRWQAGAVSGVRR